MQKRHLYHQLLPLLSHKNALIITGMRQVGKTTLMRQLYDQVVGNKLWFDLDNPLDQKTFETNDYAGLYRYLTTRVTGPNQRLYLFLDEIQNLPTITTIIKYFIDHYQVKCIVTGSSNYYLKNLFPESLAGRKFVFELAPLSFAEFLHFKGFAKIEPSNSLSKLEDSMRAVSAIEHERRLALYQEFMQYGGFPEVVMSTTIELKNLVLKNIFKSFFEKDLALITDYTDTKELRDLILLLVPRVGSMIDVSKLASELGVSRAKIYSYLEFLQHTYFIRLIPKYSRSIDRSVAGGKKIYFTDSGILQTIGAVNAGQLLENTVINQLALRGSLSFYNHRNTSEIDAIIDQSALEIKHKASVADGAKLAKLAGKLTLASHYLITLEYHPLKNTPIIPATFL